MPVSNISVTVSGCIIAMTDIFCHGAHDEFIQSFAGFPNSWCC